MKVGQKTVVRWIAKRLGKRGAPVAPTTAACSEHVLDSEILRHVAGGSGQSTSSPGKTW
jgi:hypothetical protein